MGLNKPDAYPPIPSQPKMPDYSKGKVYRILQDNEKTVYIGSTVQTLSARMAEHRKGPELWPTWKLYKLMAEVGVDHFSIELVVDFPCERREQLHAEEGRQIRLHNTITNGCNKQLAGRSKNEWYNENKEEQKEKMKAYHAAHKDEHAKQMKAYAEANKEALSAKKKAYAEANKEKISTKAKAHYEANKEAIISRVKAYATVNKEIIAAKHKQYAEANREAISAKRKARYAANREVERAQQKAYNDLKKAELLASSS